MPLIVTHRHRPEDLAHWRVCERADAINAERLKRRFVESAAAAKDVMRSFIAAGDGYLSISWGKDSLVCAHLLFEMQRDEGTVYPSVWVRLDEIENPDCVLVRDAFLERWPLAGYDEIRAVAGDDSAGGRRTAAGFRAAADRYGDRHISGVRGDESRMRQIVMARFGAATARTCRPIGRWRTADIFAYLYLHDLPVHPVYAYTMGGLYDRLRVRTAALGGSRGNGMGRGGWEAAYYGDIMRAAGVLPPNVG